MYGVDAAPEMIDLARQKARAAGLDIDFRVGIIENLPFSNDFFDVALSSLMLHHLPVDVNEAGFSELARVLKSGGRFLAGDLAIPRFSFFDVVRQHVHGQTSAVKATRSIEAMMRDAGFENIVAGKMTFAVLEYYRGTAPAQAPTHRKEGDLCD